MPAPHSGQPKAGALALIVACLAYMSLMAVHPSHAGGPSLGHITLNDAVHWTGLLVIPLLAYGYLELARWLGPSRPLVGLATCAMAFSLVAGMGAAILSGLVAPEIAHAADKMESPVEVLNAMRHFGYWLNQGFATIHYALAMISIGLFSLALLKQAKALAIGGLVLSAGFLVWLATGTWRPDIHGALFVTLAFACWTIAAALRMRKSAVSGELYNP
jgi:hypothetical protein